MENISYIIVISILINLLIQAGLIFRYYYPLLIEYFNNKKITWNSNHDRIVTVAFMMCLLLSVYFSQILFQFSKGSYFITLYLSVLVILTIFIFLIQKMGNTKRTKNILIIPNQEKKT
ncbi:hypothetical protein LPBF_00190 [Flavobacterium crassostreae]|uniref:Uncharacterized protein n=1 Tax=Flavobacterium crassostreae TaxID=1763534 RepID=A0A1B9EA70_9FLAO|nr:hypothetical protein LPBF_00190 [Flavobacterium crassostreae]